MDADEVKGQRKGGGAAGEESGFGYTVGRMNIDERLDKLTERHEALTQSVELLVHSQREAFERYDAAFEKNEAAMAKNQVLLGHVLESIDSLARIAQAHERRITGLEDRRQ
jgi:hypothetical protein